MARIKSTSINSSLQRNRNICPPPTLLNSLEHHPYQVISLHKNLARFRAQAEFRNLRHFYEISEDLRTSTATLHDALERAPSCGNDETQKIVGSRGGVWHGKEVGLRGDVLPQVDVV